MTEKQAIKIRSIFCNKIPQEQLYTRMTDELANEFDIAIEKQIPKKPTNISGRYWGKAKSGKCPICGSGVNSREYNYCKKCGQKIDWSDTK